MRYLLSFLIFFIPLATNAGYVELNYTVTDNNDGTHSFDINTTPIDLQITDLSLTGLVSYNYPVLVPEYDGITALDGCFLGAGGVSGTSNLRPFIMHTDQVHVAGDGSTADCTLSGDYYINFGTYDGNDWSCTTRDCYYIKYNYSNGIINGTGISDTFIINQGWESKYIDVILPTYATTTPTNVVDISVQFSTPVTLDYRPTTTRKYIIKDALSNVIEYEYSVDISPNSSENITINETLNLTTGSKIIEAYYTDQNNIIYSELDSSFFNVVENTYLLQTGIDNPEANASGLNQIDCSLYDVGCQFQKAIMFLFYPSPRALEKFGNIWQSLSYIAPFGYVTVTLEQLKTLDTNATPLFSFGVLPFQDAIFTPISDSLSNILWALFAIYFFLYRLRHLDI